MKKTILLLVFFVAFVSQVSAQFNFADKPFKAPKKAINIEKAGLQIKMQVGQMAYYQWARQGNMDGFSIAITEGMDNVEKKETHLFTNPKTRDKITTWQWIAVKKGAVKMEILDEAGKEKIINITIE